MIDSVAAARMSCPASTPALLLQAEAAVIAFCDELRQVNYISRMVTGRLEAFVAWFRVEHEHVHLVEAQDFEAIRALPRAELTTGPVLLVADVAGPRHAPGYIARLRRLPGVEVVMGFRKGKIRRYRMPSCRG